MPAADVARIEAAGGWGRPGGGAPGAQPTAPPLAASPGGGAADAAGSRPDSAAPPGAPAPGAEVVPFNWARKAARPAAEAALSTLVAAMADDPVNAFLLGGSPSAAFAAREIKGYLKALPRAAHFIATRDAAAVALWQLVRWRRGGAGGGAGGAPLAAAAPARCRIIAPTPLPARPAPPQLPNETPRNELLAGWSRIFRVPLRLWPALVALELRYEAAHAAIAAEAPGGY